MTPAETDRVRPGRRRLDPRGHPSTPLLPEANRAVVVIHFHTVSEQEPRLLSLTSRFGVLRRNRFHSSCRSISMVPRFRLGARHRADGGPPKGGNVEPLQIPLELTEAWRHLDGTDRTPGGLVAQRLERATFPWLVRNVLQASGHALRRARPRAEQGGLPWRGRGLLGEEMQVPCWFGSLPGFCEPWTAFNSPWRSSFKSRRAHRC